MPFDADLDLAASAARNGIDADLDRDNDDDDVDLEEDFYSRNQMVFTAGQGSGQILYFETSKFPKGTPIEIALERYSALGTVAGQPTYNTISNVTQGAARTVFAQGAGAGAGAKAGGGSPPSGAGSPPASPTPAAASLLQHNRPRKPVLGVIYAPKNSDRFPNQPLALLGERPLVAHAVTNAMACPELDCVVVATNSKATALVSAPRGAALMFIVVLVVLGLGLGLGFVLVPVLVLVGIGLRVTLVRINPSIRRCDLIMHLQSSRRLCRRLRRRAVRW